MPDPEDEINMSTQVYYAGYQGGVLVYSTNGKWGYKIWESTALPNGKMKTPFIEEQIPTYQYKIEAEARGFWRYCDLLTDGKWLYGQTDRDWIPHPRPKG